MYVDSEIKREIHNFQFVAYALPSFVHVQATLAEPKVLALKPANFQLDVDALQDFKTECYKKLVTTASPRAGILALMDAAIATPGLAVGICSASTRGGFEKVVDSVVGKARLAKLDVIIAGDDVSRKKPDPEIYNVAAQRLGLSADKCVVVEDSMVGLRAAKAAGMKCVITYTPQTDQEDFYAAGADAKLLDFGAVGGKAVQGLFSADGAVLDELLAGSKD